MTSDLRPYQTVLVSGIFLAGSKKLDYSKIYYPRPEVDKLLQMKSVSAILSLNLVEFRYKMNIQISNCKTYLTCSRHISLPFSKGLLLKEIISTQRACRRFTLTVRLNLVLWFTGSNMHEGDSAKGKVHLHVMTFRVRSVT